MVSATWPVQCGNKSEMFLGTRDKRQKQLQVLHNFCSAELQHPSVHLDLT